MKALEWPGYDLEKAWSLEANSLHELSALRNEHLIKPVAAFTKSNKFYFIFEWAEGGTLRDYWQKNPNPDLSPSLIRTTLKQLLGLARAISALHHDGNRNDRNHDATNDDTKNDDTKNGVATMENDNTESNWRHGDLKPDNILRFLDHTEDESHLGILRIADLGLAKRHMFRTAIRDNPTVTKFGTSQYEPPEALTHPRDPRSRLYDIWSMGCIIFEFTVWLLYGLPGLTEFLNEDCIDTPHSNLFFACFHTFNRLEARLNDNGVWKWMTRILPQDEECRETKECDDHEGCDDHAQLGTAIGDLLKLVRTRLLVINLPEKVKGAPHRGDANVLVDELDKILRRAQNDTYALSTGRRSGIKPPEPANPLPESTQSQPIPAQSSQKYLSPHDQRVAPQTSSLAVPERSFQNKRVNSCFSMKGLSY